MTSGLVLPEACKAFGAGVKNSRLQKYLDAWLERKQDFSLVLVLAGSLTAEVEGISAAGATSASRRYTALADAELILYGPEGARNYSLPPLPAGVSPALISYVASRRIGVKPLVISVGLFQSPSFPHLRVESPSLGPALCVSTGQAMDISRVKLLWERGLLMGRKLTHPLLLSECVPGGTTTAQAVLTGLGLPVADLISGSARNPPMALKKELVDTGLNAAAFSKEVEPQDLMAAVGDPFQPLAVGLLVGAREAGQAVLLGGGSQMLAVLALALRSLKPSMRKMFVDGVALGTTSWLLEERTSSALGAAPLVRLMDRIGENFDVSLLGFATGLHFFGSKHQPLLDYELGYVKEGVGAGALAFLAQLQGASCAQLVESCEEAIDELQREI